MALAVRQTREGSLFASGDKYITKRIRARTGPEYTAALPPSWMPADPFVKLALPHTFCHAPDYYNTFTNYAVLSRGPCQNDEEGTGRT